MSLEMIEKVSELIEELSQIRAASARDQELVAEATKMLASMGEELKRLFEILRYQHGKPYRSKSEKVSPNQLAFDLIEMLLHKKNDEEGPAAVSEKDDGAKAGGEPESPAPVPTKKKRVRRGRELRRKIVENRLSEDERHCETCHVVKKEMGFDTRERFIYKPAEIYILEEHFYKYACKDDCCGVEIAPEKNDVASKPIPGSMASASLLAYLIVSKFLDGLPIERIAKKLRRHGADLSTSTLNDWMAHAARMFSFLYKIFENELRASSLISLDDTPMPAQSRGHPSGIQRGRQWIYLGDLDRVAYAEFTPDWKGSHPRRVLNDFRGDVQNDGYAGIIGRIFKTAKKLATDGSIRI